MSASPRNEWHDALLFDVDDRVDAYGLAVARVLHAHMNAGGRCRVGVRRIAALARCTVPTARKRLGALVEAGWLTVAGGDRQRATYQATVPAAARPVDDPHEAVASVQPDDADCATSRGDLRNGVAHVHPEPRRTPRRRPPDTRAPRRRAGWHDPSVGRPPPDRPPAEVSHLVERGDGTLWVELGAVA